MRKFLTIVLAMQIVFSCVPTNGVMSDRNPIFTIHLSPPVNWTYQSDVNRTYQSDEIYVKPMKAKQHKENTWKF
ncbi:unnamed protein product [Onchocerca ochengi]|uniref:Secreted protein n=2 Tax=Onchocerca TaxID=6281 RepID=A0A182ETD0_ONCOC|nr:unnamed protein product [Onchocerca ochengi]